MAIICIGSTKGGCGKTTTVINLAVEARKRGYTAAIIDADPQHHAFDWVMKHQGIAADQASANAVYSGQFDIDAVCKITADTVADNVVALAQNHDVVIIDLQGSANQTMVFAFAAADLVIVPAQPSNFDIGGAELTIRTLRKTAQSMRRDIVERILLTRTAPAFKTRADATTRATFDAAGLTVMATEFMDRTAFRDQTFTGDAPTMREPNSNAAKNVATLFDEMLSILAPVTANAE